MYLAMGQTVLILTAVFITAQSAAIGGLSSCNDTTDMAQLKQDLALSHFQMMQFTLPVNIRYETVATTWRNLTVLPVRIASHPDEVPCENWDRSGTDHAYNPSNSLCGWSYKCNYDPGRLPHYMFTAECNESTKITIESSNYYCRPVIRPIKVLRFAGCHPHETWNLENVLISVGCVPKKIT